ncbi:hypothetical protein V462_11025 [Pantoea ananatis 15320]|nr:hypothetical protein V462_11025 [Pantoea ananatis 15320]
MIFYFFEFPERLEQAPIKFFNILSFIIIQFGIFRFKLVKQLIENVFQRGRFFGMIQFWSLATELSQLYRIY